MRLASVLLLTLVATPLGAQRPTAPRGGAPQLAGHWIPLDSLAATLELSDEQRAAAAPHHAAIDSLVRRGAELRNEMRTELQRTRDRDAAQRYMGQLEGLQREANEHLEMLRGTLSDVQGTALAALRAPQIAPTRRRQRQE